MEVKVDVRKLQLLNDRINQCMDALQQVRFNVQGISHTPQYNVPQPFVPVQGLSHTPQIPYTYPTMQQPFAPIQGLQHTAPLYPQPVYTQPVLPQTIMEPEMFRGLSHTTPWNVQQRFEIERTNDPNRIARTFPYAFARIPSVNIW